MEKPGSLTYAAQAAVLTVATAMAPDAPSSTGGAIDAYSVAPALPAGLALDTKTGVISGTPTAVTAAATYTVTGANAAGSATAALSFTVNDRAPSGLAYASALHCTKGTACSLPAPAHGGGAVVSFAVSPALPAGLALAAATGAISGTPTALSAAATYTVTATNSGGSTQGTVSIDVVDAAPANLAYAGALACTTGVACSLAAPTHGGGAVVSFSISPALPAGLVLDAATGAIAGTPTAAAATASYTVTATNTGGSTTATVSVTVIKPPPALSAATKVDDVLFGAIASAQYPVAATDGTNQVYLWSDSRTSGTGRLFAARFGPGGTVLDPAGVLLGSFPGGFEYNLSIAWNGTFYFVCDNRITNSGGLQSYSLGCFTLSADLATQGARTEVASSANNVAVLTGGAMVWNPDQQQFFLAWVPSSYSARQAPFNGVRFDASGVLLDATPVVVRPSGTGSYAYDRSMLKLAYGGGYYLITSSEGGTGCGGYHLDLTRVKASDLTGGGDYGPLNPSCQNQGDGTLAYDSDANQFLVLINENNLYLRTVSNGAADTTATLGARVTISNSGIRMAAIAAKGGEKLIAIAPFSGPPVLTALNASNEIATTKTLDAPARPEGVTGQVNGVSVLPSPSGWAVAFNDDRAAAGLYEVRLSGALTTSDGSGVVAVSGANGEGFPCAASAGPGKGWLVAWFDAHNGPAWYARRLADDGTPLDAGPVLLGAASEDPAGCAAAYSAGNYLVTWNAPSNAIFGARVDATSGALKDATPFTLGGTINNAPAAAGGADGFLVTWTSNSMTPRQCGTTNCYFPVVAAHVGTDGTVAEPEGFVLSEVAGGNDLTGGLSAVWFDGTAYQTAYSASVDNAGQIFNRAVPATSAVTAAPLLVGTGAAQFLGPVIGPDNAGGSIVVWTEFGNTDSTVKARHIVGGAAQGADAQDLATGSGASLPGRVQLASDGATTWLAVTSGPYVYQWGNLQSTGSSSISVQPLTAALTLGTALSIGDTGLPSPVLGLSGNGAGTVLAAYSAWDALVLNSRVVVREIK